MTQHQFTLSAGKWRGRVASLVMGLLLAGVGTAHAQTTQTVDPIEPDNAAENDESLFDRGLSSPFELYHRANLANDRTQSEFVEEQRSDLGLEADSFRQRQMELLMQSQPTAPDATATPDANTAQP